MLRLRVTATNSLSKGFQPTFRRTLSNVVSSQSRPLMAVSHPSILPRTPLFQPLKSIRPLCRSYSEEAAPAPFEPIELNSANFQQAVVKSSVPVIVNCYTDWAEPCKALTAQLSSIIQNTKGAVRLANLNVDKNQEISQALQLSEVPTVFAFWDGKFVDGFKGEKTDDEIQEFVNDLMRKGGSHDVDAMMDEADQKLREGDTQGAQAIYQSILDKPQLKGEVFALAGVARAAVMENRMDAAVEIINHIKQHFPKDLNHPQVKKALVAVEMTEKTEGVNISELEKQIEQNPEDLNLRLQLATTHVALGNQPAGIEICFQILKKDKLHEPTRELITKIFDSYGPKDPFVKTARRRLSNILFV
ncbi:thioredoxin [Planoprotostelium fungivorum]|uniref:Thioredoxin n=1 Tax=Planoprotostelium fungivorum TaxID=1890364 RepID=A0A2P6N123_9EUKA|nr:thioredoxin [Planoprotostelium fungivorum]